MLTQLRDIEVELDDLYLDPNNPRFSDLQDRVQAVPLERTLEEGVQAKALSRILDDRFGVDELRNSISSIGFLKVDRLVVTPLPSQGKYVVREGNRRLGALKSLLADFKSGEVDLSTEARESFQKIPVVVIDEPDPVKREHLARILQGVRHVAGIRDWGPYQQAGVVAMMLDDGRDQAEICEVLGLSKRRVNILRRCFYALKQMSDDDDYGDKVKPILFSYFEEVLKLPQLRDQWLEWDDEQNLFLNEARRKQLYSWFVGIEDEDGTGHPPKIPDNKQIRRLPDLMADALLFKRFSDIAALKLEEAVQGLASPKPGIAWQDSLQSLLTVLNQVPAVDLETASDSDKGLLEQVKQVCEKHLKLLISANS